MHRQPIPPSLGCTLQGTPHPLGARCRAHPTVYASHTLLRSASLLAAQVCEEGHEPAAFWEALGGQGAISPATCDDEFETLHPHAGVPKLFCVSDASGSVQFSEVVAPDTSNGGGILGRLSRELLDRCAISPQSPTISPQSP